MLDDKNMLNRKRNSLIITVVALVMVLGISFAFFASVINKNAQTNIILGFDGGYEFKTTSEDPIKIKPEELSMFQGSRDTVAAVGTQNIKVDLTALDETGYYCTFDFVWEWNSGEYTISTEGVKELTVSSSYGEFQVPNYGSEKKVLFSSSISATGTVTTSKDYNLSVNFYNLANVDQSAHVGKSYNGSVKIDNVVCNRNLSGQVLSLKQNINNYTDYTSSQDSSVYRVVDQNGVRYEGKDPDNYVYFNGNEKWRIIGTFDGKDIRLTEGKKYTKIIKETSIGNYAWDEGNENDWENSTLKAYLNGTYLNSLSTKNMIVNATWDLRGVDEGTHNGENAYTPDWYLHERLNGTAGYKDGEPGGAKYSIQASVGLMYPSDYGYAAYGTECDNENSATLFNYVYGCAAVDWLAQDSLNDHDEWLISPSPDYSNVAFILYGTAGGYIYGDGGVYISFAARPTLYLEDSVTIIDGTGKSSDPYVLAMPSKNLSEEVISKISDYDYTSSQDGTIYKVADEGVEYDGEMLSAGIRYEGKDPDNYVTFNNEEWRIIGAFEGATIGLEPGKQYTKIIKSTKLDAYAWDKCDNFDIVSFQCLSNTVENDWENSTLNAYLNSEYLDSLSGRTKIAIYNGNYSTWYLKGLDKETHEGESADTREWYLAERYTGHPGYKDGVQYGAKSEIQAAVGLIYPSDYGYAAYGNECDSMTLYNFSESCAIVDWLAQDSLWSHTERLLSPSSNKSWNAFVVYINVTSASIVYEWDIRPTLYLEHDVEIISGDGSKTNPYVIEESNKTLSDEVISKESDSDYTSSQDRTIYKVSYQNGYRYAGKDPDNYVTFNGESAGWRIIGTFEGSEIGLASGEYYTKIIRATSIGDYAWDCSNYNYDEGYCEGEYENDWENATLKTYLNGEYLSSLTSKSIIANAVWYLKGIDEGTHIGDDGVYTPDWYIFERYTGYTGYKDGTEYGAKAEIKAAIGLMYPSDYGYAAYGTECDNKSSMTLYNYDRGCAAVDWLAQDSLDSHEEWLISQTFVDWFGVFSISSNGRVFVHSVDDGTIAARPTLYLKSDVKVKDGSGSKTDPYILDL